MGKPLVGGDLAEVRETLGTNLLIIDRLDNCNKSFILVIRRPALQLGQPPVDNEKKILLYLPLLHRVEESPPT